MYISHFHWLMVQWTRSLPPFLLGRLSKHTHTHARTHACTHAHTHTHMHTHTHTHTHTSLPFTLLTCTTHTLLSLSTGSAGRHGGRCGGRDAKGTVRRSVWPPTTYHRCLRLWKQLVGTFCTYSCPQPAPNLSSKNCGEPGIFFHMSMTYWYKNAIFI